MPQLIRKENMTIVTGTYIKDGVEKKRYRTIGEIVTMQGDDGSTYQFGETWGPGGCTQFNIYSQDDKQQAQPQQQPMAQPQMAPQQPMQQQPQQQPQQGFNPNQGQYPQR